MGPRTPAHDKDTQSPHQLTNVTISPLHGRRREEGGREGGREGQKLPLFPGALTALHEHVALLEILSFAPVSLSPPLPLYLSPSRLLSPGALTALHEHAELSLLPAGKKELLGQEKHAALPAGSLCVPVHQRTASRLVSTCCPFSGRM